MKPLPELQTGDIICYKSDANWHNFFTSKELFVAFMIKIGTFSDYVHAGIVLDEKPLMFGQALSEFVITQEKTYLTTLWNQDKILIKRIPDLTKEQKKDIVRIGHELEGADYDWSGIFKMALYLLTGKTLFKDNANKFFCSEIIEYILRKVGVRLFNKLARNVFPADYVKTNKILIVN